MDKQTELLAPAGTLEKLKWAVAYGADAVYFGAGYSLRSFAGNFSIDEIQDGIDYLHTHGKKGYITLNSYPFSDEYDGIVSLAKQVDDMGADALIIADMGVFYELKKLGLKAKLHISTQANTMSAQAVLAYQQMGASRANLARELSLEKIVDLQKRILGSGMETEVFVHGAVCFSYSGRCAISDYMTGRRANHGECTHPCRWKYHLMEEQRDGEYYPVFEDDHGLYFYNSKDLALFEYIPALVEAGVNSFKIEGRMKSIHYIASVVSLYRRILDGEEISYDYGMALLSRVKNRGYSQGFMKGNITVDDYQLGDNHSDSAATFVGNVLGDDELVDGKKLFRVRNKVHAAETLEVLTPDGKLTSLTLSNPLVNSRGEQLEFANNEEKIVIENNLPEFTIIRRYDANKIIGAKNG